MEPTDPHLTLAQAGDELQLSRTTLHRLVADGRLPAEKIGTGRTSAYLTRRSAVDALKRETAEQRRTGVLPD